MKSLLALLMLGLSLTTAPTVSLAAEGAIKITDAVCPPPPTGAPTAAGYLVIKNNGAASDTLLGGSTAAAAKLELHSMTMTGGIMRMRPVVGGLPIPAGATVKIVSESGYHLMLIHPKRPFRLGQRLPMTLQFAKAGAVKTSCLVGPASTKDMDMGPAAKGASAMKPMKM